MPPRNRNLAILGAAIGLMVVVFYCYNSFFYGPLKKRQQDLQAKFDVDKRRLDEAIAKASQLDKLRAEMAGLQVEVAQLEKQLPKNRELPSLLRVVTHRAEAYGVNIVSLQPQKPIPKTLYDEISYNISATASFHGIGRFLAAMGKGERLFAARNLVLTGASNKADPSRTVNATFQLVSFKYHE